MLSRVDEQTRNEEDGDDGVEQDDDEEEDGDKEDADEQDEEDGDDEYDGEDDDEEVSEMSEVVIKTEQLELMEQELTMVSNLKGPFQRFILVTTKSARLISWWSGIQVEGLLVVLFPSI